MEVEEPPCLLKLRNGIGNLLDDEDSYTDFQLRLMENQPILLECVVSEPVWNMMVAALFNEGKRQSTALAFVYSHLGANSEASKKEKTFASTMINWDNPLIRV
jgi:hypothetical protein